MVLKGQVSTVNNENRKARIILVDRDNNITPEIPVAPHVGNLAVNDMVVVAVFSDNFSDSLVIAKF
ncbi:hypothetical protein [Ruminiclostridium josui]|uniref:hypothetical protein n=1 Tax=Ruminiclostridium josui TaxID=1499 RepID=UPI000465EE70|nr:hypothetical protein [Ruminiclostridium josui]